MTSGDEPPPSDEQGGELEPRGRPVEPLPDELPFPPDQTAFWAAWYYSGPIPLPRIVEGWENVLPGAADRILSMAEREQVHQHGLDRRGLTLFARGQMFALILGLAAIVVGGLFGGGWGFAVIVTAVAGIVGAFLLNRRGPYPPPPPPPPGDAAEVGEGGQPDDTP